MSDSDEDFVLIVEESESEDELFLEHLPLDLLIDRRINDIYTSSQSREDKINEAERITNKLRAFLQEYGSLNLAHFDWLRSAPLELVPVLFQHFDTFTPDMLVICFNKIFKRTQLNLYIVNELVSLIIVNFSAEDMLRALFQIMETEKGGAYMNLVCNKKFRKICQLESIASYCEQLIFQHHDLSKSETFTPLLVNVIQQSIRADYNVFGKVVYGYILDHLELFEVEFVDYLLSHLQRQVKHNQNIVKDYIDPLLQLIGQAPALEKVFIKFMVYHSEYFQNYYDFAAGYPDSHPALRRILCKLLQAPECKTHQRQIYQYYLAQLELAENNVPGAVQSLLQAGEVMDASDLKSRLIGSYYFLEPLSEQPYRNLEVTSESVVELLGTIRELRTKIKEFDRSTSAVDLMKK